MWQWPHHLSAASILCPLQADNKRKVIAYKFFFLFCYTKSMAFLTSRRSYTQAKPAFFTLCPRGINLDWKHQFCEKFNMYFFSRGILKYSLKHTFTSTCRFPFQRFFREKILLFWNRFNCYFSPRSHNSPFPHHFRDHI